MERNTKVTEKKTLIEFNNITKKYQVGDSEITALDNISFTINEGEFVVILGDSGAGKSTLLNILGGMDKPSSGSFYVNDKEVSSFKEKELSLYRRHEIGFVFQFYNLIPHLNAYENVALAASVAHNPLDVATTLALVGLEKRINQFPSSLSGGEQQRVAIARAIVRQPLLLLCDEPTGALDSKTGKDILKLLQDISLNGKTVIVVTHNSVLADIATRVIRVRDGQIVENKIQDHPKDINDVKW